MILRRAAMDTSVKEAMHGGRGRASSRALVPRDLLLHSRYLSETTLEPGATIGGHRHLGETEYYLILEGRGLADDNGEKAELGPGDVLVTGHGESHSLENTGPGQLRFIVLINCHNGLLAPDARRLILAGDSTLSDYGPDRHPRAGWGMCLAPWLAKGVEVVNCAQSGRSTRSYIQEGFWEALCKQIRPGDGVMIQFGHNDEKDDPARGTTPGGSFDANLRYFVEEIRVRGAEAFLLTPVQRRTFEGARLVDSHGPWAEAVRTTAAALGAPLLDLGRESQACFESLGPAACARFFLHLAAGEFPAYPEGVADDTHFSLDGAAVVAGLVGRMLARHPAGRSWTPAMDLPGSVLSKS